MTTTILAVRDQMIEILIDRCSVALSIGNLTDAQSEWDTIQQVIEELAIEDDTSAYRITRMFTSIGYTGIRLLAARSTARKAIDEAREDLV